MLRAVFRGDSLCQRQKDKGLGGKCQSSVSGVDVLVVEDSVFPYATDDLHPALGQASKRCAVRCAGVPADRSVPLCGPRMLIRHLPRREGSIKGLLAIITVRAYATVLYF